MATLRTCMAGLAVASVVVSSASCAGTAAGDVVEAGELGDEVVSTEPAQEGASGPTTGLLYVARAGSAQVEGDWPTVQVTLSETEAEVLWFQDRPGRAAGEMRTAEFVEQWAEVGFDRDPPNAVIHHDAGDGLGTVVEMSDPVWDQPTGRLSFTATVAEPQQQDTEPLPWLMADVSLFVDDSAASYTPVVVSVSDLQPGQTVGIELGAQGSQAPAWSLGPTDPSAAGMSLSAGSGALPLGVLAIDGARIRLGAHDQGAGGGTSVGISAQLYLEVPPGVSGFFVSATSDPGVEVRLGLGDAQPQVVNADQTPFEVDPS